MEEGDPELKVVMVGPPGSGKSSMILSLTSDAYKNISEHTTTVFDKYCAKVEDSAGQSYQLRCGNPTQSCVQQCESLIPFIRLRTNEYHYPLITYYSSITH